MATNVQSASLFHAANLPSTFTNFDTCPCRMFHAERRREVRGHVVLDKEDDEHGFDNTLGAHCS